MAPDTNTEHLLKQEAWLLRDKYDGVHSKAFEIDKDRLRQGEPLAYIIGWAPFLDTKIWLDSLPLIPRAETEFWVGEAIKEMREHANGSAVRVLDLCAGSGCIGVSVLKTIPNARVDFAEIQEELHPNILKNIRMNEIDESRVRIFGGDLFSEIPDTEQYNFILTNPPYIDPALNRTGESVRKFEPHNALYGGVAGFEIIERIIRELPDRLRRSGTCYLEHEPEQEGLTAECASKNSLVSKTFPDQYGIQRYTKITHKNMAE